jgi:hypothetical protein
VIERRVRIKLVDEHRRPGKPALHRAVCEFHKYSFGDRATGIWETEPWTVAQFPMSRKEHEYHERVCQQKTEV